MYFFLKLLDAKSAVDLRFPINIGNKHEILHSTMHFCIYLTFFIYIYLYNARNFSTCI